MAKIIVNHEVHAAMTREAAAFLADRDRMEIGNGAGPKLTRLQRIELEAAARVDASRLMDRLAEILDFVIRRRQAA